MSRKRRESRISRLRRMICPKCPEPEVAVEPEPCPPCPDPEPCPPCPDPVEPDRNTWCHFSREDEPAINHAIGFVNHCPDGSSISLAAYAFTVRKLALALIDAHQNRGCIVRVIIDNARSSAQAKMIVRLLQDAGIPVKQDKVPWYNDDGSYVYETDDDGNVLLEDNGSPEIKYGEKYKSRGYKGSTIHHNKYIIEHKPDKTGSVFTGSFNFSANAQSNFENILITRDFLATQEFQENFDNNWNDNDPEDGHFDFIPVEYVYDVENNEVTSEIAIVTTKYRGKIRTHDPYDESEWESQN